MYMYVYVDGWMDKWIYGLMYVHVCIYGWMDGSMDRSMD